MFWGLLLFLGLIKPSDLPPGVSPATLFSGRIFTDQVVGIEDPRSGDWLQNSLTIWIATSPNFSDTLGAHVEFGLNTFFRSVAHGDATVLNPFLREGYGVWTPNAGFSLRAGQQIILWGKSDGVNPTDYLTAKDYRFYNPDDEVRRKGAVALDFSYTPKEGNSPWNVVAVYQLAAPRSDFLVPTASIPAGVSVTTEPEEKVKYFSDQSEFALKLQYLGGAFDASLSGFRGRMHFPQFTYDGARIAPVFLRETAFGGDASFTSGEYIFRLESAAHLPEGGGADSPTLGLTEPNHWDTVLGVERPFARDFRIQLQALYRYHLAFRDPSEYTEADPVATQIKRGAGRANAILLNYRDRENLGGTLRLAWAPERGDFGAEISTIGYFASSDYLLRPSVNYHATDSLRVFLGADLYGGPKDETLGALKEYSAVYAEARYVF